MTRHLLGIKPFSCSQPRSVPAEMTQRTFRVTLCGSQISSANKEHTVGCIQYVFVSVCEVVLCVFLRDPSAVVTTPPTSQRPLGSENHLCSRSFRHTALYIKPSEAHIRFARLVSPQTNMNTWRLSVLSCCLKRLRGRRSLAVCNSAQPVSGSFKLSVDVLWSAAHTWFKIHPLHRKNEFLKPFVMQLKREMSFLSPQCLDCLF